MHTCVHYRLWNCRQTDRSDRQTDRQTVPDRLTDRQTDRLYILVSV